jgi:hypothetical protein
MNSRRQSCCQRPTMSGFRFIFRTLSLLRTTIMLLIRSTPNYDFVRKNHQRRTRLKRLFKLCSLLAGSYNNNIRPKTTNTTMSSFVTYSRLRKHDELTIKNHHQCYVGAAPLPEIHHNEKKASTSKDSNPKKNGRSARRRRNRRKNRQLSKTMKRMVPLLRGWHAELSSIQLRSVIHLSTLCHYTRNP